MKGTPTNIQGNKVLVVTLICVLSLSNVNYAYAFDWNPLNWGETTITTKNKYKLAFFNQNIPDKEIILVKTTNNYEIVYMTDEAGEEQILDCNELKEITEIQSIKTGARVGLASLVAGAAISAMTGGATLPIVLVAFAGGGASYITRGLPPSEFCHT